MLKASLSLIGLTGFFHWEETPMVVATKRTPATAKPKIAGKVAPLKVKGKGPCRISHSIDGRNMMQADLPLESFWATINGMHGASSGWTPGRHKFVIEIDHRPGASTKKA
jgi:hypothetical protein